MTITDEERREMARKLRELPDDVYPVEKAWNDEGILHDRLADLIDRPTCFDTENKESKFFTCSACGFSDSRIAVNPFTLSLRYVKPSYRYRPSCGAEVVG